MEPLGHAVAACATLVCLLVLPASSANAPDDTRERQVKAAFVFNVLKFVEWPPAAQPAASAPLRVGVLGSGPLAELATALVGKTIKGRVLSVQTYQRVDQIDDCQVLVITADAAVDLRDALRATSGKAVLTMSEQHQPTPTAAIITLTVVDTKLAFHVNLDAADASGLQLSSNLLGLAKSVQSQRLRQGRP